MDFKSLVKKFKLYASSEKNILSLGLNSLEEFIVITKDKWYYFSDYDFLNFLGEVKKVHLKINESKMIVKIEDFSFVINFYEDINLLLGKEKIVILVDKEDTLKGLNYLLK